MTDDKEFLFCSPSLFQMAVRECAIELGDLKIVTFRLSPQYWVMRLRGNGGFLAFAAFFPLFSSYIATQKFGDSNVGRFVLWAGINFRLN